MIQKIKQRLAGAVVIVAIAAIPPAAVAQQSPYFGTYVGVRNLPAEPTGCGASDITIERLGNIVVAPDPKDPTKGKVMGQAKVTIAGRLDLSTGRFETAHDGMRPHDIDFFGQITGPTLIIKNYLTSGKCAGVREYRKQS
jgi:hypothetical protein